MRDSITIYDAKFTVYSAHQTLSKLRMIMRIGHIVTEEDYRLLCLTDEDLLNALKHEWDLGKV